MSQSRSFVHRAGSILARVSRFGWKSVWVVSLLLMCCMIAAWILSYRRGDAIGIERTQFADDSTTTLAFTSGRGELALGYTHSAYPMSVVEDIPGTAISRVRYERIHYRYQAPMKLQDMLQVSGPPPSPNLITTYSSYPGLTPPAPPWQPTIFNRAGFGGKIEKTAPLTAGLPDSYRIHRVAVLPYWFLTAACALLPLARLRTALRARRRRTRLRRGLCPVCGYDLRTSPGKCSECGYVAAQV